MATLLSALNNAYVQFSIALFLQNPDKILEAQLAVREAERNFRLYNDSH